MQGIRPENIIYLTHVIEALLVVGFFKSINSLITSPLRIKKNTHNRKHHEKSLF